MPSLSFSGTGWYSGKSARSIAVSVHPFSWPSPSASAVRGPLTARKFQCSEEERSRGYRYPAPEPMTCHVLFGSLSLPNNEPIPSRVFSVSPQPPELNSSQNHEFMSSPKLPPRILRYSMSIFSVSRFAGGGSAVNSIVWFLSLKQNCSSQV